jgi:hypothetical protein
MNHQLRWWDYRASLGEALFGFFQQPASSEAFSLAEIKELGFNISSETVQAIREFRRLAFGRKLTIN